jgi:hypothetical protein
MSRMCRLVVVVGAIALQGCGSSWSQYAITAGDRPALPSDSEVRVTRTDDRFLVIERARFAGDSLIGEYGSPSRRWAIATADIKQLEVRSAEAAAADRRAAVGLGAAVGGVAIVAGVTIVTVLVFLLSALK